MSPNRFVSWIPVLAASAGLFAQTEPAEIRLDRTEALLRVGETLTIRPTVLDPQSRPIPNARLTFHSTLANVAQVDAAGVVTAVSAGRASIAVQLPEGPVLAGASMVIHVLPPLPYKISPFVDLSTSRPAAAQSLEKISTAGDWLAGIGNFDHGGQAVLIREPGGRWVMLGAVGQEIPAAGVVPTRVLAVSVNSRGDAAFLVQGARGWCGRSLLYAPRGGAAELVISSSCNLQLAPGALATDGTIVFREGNQMFRRSANGSVAAIFSPPATPADPAATISIHNYSSLHDGTAVTAGSTANGRPCWDHFDGRQWRRILTVQDRIGSEVVNGLNSVESQHGAYMGHVNMSRAPAIVQLLPTPRVIASSGSVANGQRLNFIQTVIDGADGEALIVAYLATESDQDLGVNLIRLKSGEMTRVARLAAWDAVVGGAFAGKDVVAFLSPHASSSPLSLSRYQGSQPLEIRLPLNLSLPAAIDHFVASGAPSGLATLAPGASLADVTPAGVRPVAAVGSLFNGKPWSRIYNAVPSGGATVFSGSRDGAQGLYLSRNGVVTTLLDTSTTYKDNFGNKMNWVWGHRDPYLAINSREQIAAVAGFQNDSIVTLRAGETTARIIAHRRSPVPGGGAYSFNHVLVSIDESGRVYFSMADGFARMFSWDGTAVRRIFDGAVPDESGRRFSLIQAIVMAGGAPAVLAEGAGGTQLRTWDGNAWRTLASTDSTVTPDGLRMQSFYRSRFAGAPNGDMAWISHISDGSMSVFVRKPDGRLLRVANTYDRIGEAWPQEFLTIAFGPGGDLYFTALVLQDGRERLASYRATP